MAVLHHRRRNKINLHFGNQIKYSGLNEGGLTKTVKWLKENNECCEVNTILFGSAWINIENERKKKNVWNLKICVTVCERGFDLDCVRLDRSVDCNLLKMGAYLNDFQNFFLAKNSCDCQIRWNQIAARVNTMNHFHF